MNLSLRFGLAACASALIALGGCKKKEDKDDAPAVAAPPAPAPAPDPAAAAPPVDQAAAAPAPPTGSDVQRYPNETPMGNVTVRAVIPFNVYRAADLQSEKLGSIAEGTFVDVQATYANWILVMWPSGVGQLSPGWAPIPNVNDRRLAMVTEKEKIEDPRWSGRGRTIERPGTAPKETDEKKKRRPILRRVDDR